MSISTIAQRSKQVISKNAPAILSGVAIAGTVVTTVLAGRAGYKAGYEVATDEAVAGIKGDESVMDRRKRLAKKTWGHYTAPVATGVGTIAAIATSTRISTNRTAALAAAYTIVDRAFDDYKDKVIETVGENKHKAVQDKVVQDRVNEKTDAAMIVISGSDVLCYDAFSDRYFPSSMEKIKKAQNDTNYELMNNLYVSLSDFYHRLGIPATGFSDDVGWNSEDKVELHFSSVMTPDDRPALGFTFHTRPYTRYAKTHG